MAFNATFYTFAKKLNSTKQPITGGTTFSVELKDNCSVVNPVLRVHGASANFNPSDLNYCYISTFSRYYWVNDWVYNLGEWECDLNSDVLATFKTGIGGMSKYILRSAYANNTDIVDDFYPPLAAQVSNDYTDSFSFWSFTSITGLSYILGIANTVPSDTGALCYYCLNDAQLHNLLYDMMPPPSASMPWSQDFTGMTDILYRSIYAPFDYIKTCKIFPFVITTQQARDYIEFGNYTSNTQASTIDKYLSDWQSFSHVFSLPSGWNSLEARYRTNPYCTLFFKMNPFGIIELNPMDFYNSNKLKANIDIDLISGNALLKLYKVVNGSDYFITQSKAKIAYDVPLTSSSIDATGLLRNIANVGIGVGSVIAGIPEISLASMANSGISVMQNLAPTIKNATGGAMDDIRFLDGDATLILKQTAFADGNTAEFGKPLYETRQISTIPGFIKCGDGDCDGAGAQYLSDKEAISGYLTNGFFFE